MENDRNRNPAAVYEDMIAILKAQVEKQEQIIQTRSVCCRNITRIWQQSSATTVKTTDTRRQPQCTTPL